MMIGLNREQNIRKKKLKKIINSEIKKINNTLYLNSGDWVENLTALVETHEGEWKIVYYNEIEKERNENTLCDSSDR